MDFVTKVDHVINPTHARSSAISKGYQDTESATGQRRRAVLSEVACLVEHEAVAVQLGGQLALECPRERRERARLGQNHFTFDFVNPSGRSVAGTAWALPGPIARAGGLSDRQSAHDRHVSGRRQPELVRAAPTASSSARTCGFQRHTDIRGIGRRRERHADRRTSARQPTVDPATFGIPANINTAFDRPDPPEQHQLPARPGGHRSRRGSSRAATPTRPAARCSTSPRGIPRSISTRRTPGSRGSNLTVDAGLRWEAKLAHRPTPMI